MGRRRRSVSNISVPDRLELAISILINSAVLCILGSISISLFLYGTKDPKSVIEVLFWGCCSGACFLIGLIAFLIFTVYETLDIVMYIWIFILKHLIVPFKVTVIGDEVRFNRWFWYSRADLVRWKFRYYPFFGTLVCVHKHDKKRLWAIEKKVVDFLIEEGAKVEIDPREEDQLTRIQNFIWNLIRRKWVTRNKRRKR